MAFSSYRIPRVNARSKRENDRRSKNFSVTDATPESLTQISRLIAKGILEREHKARGRLYMYIPRSIIQPHERRRPYMWSTPTSAAFFSILIILAFLFGKLMDFGL